MSKIENDPSKPLTTQDVHRVLTVATCNSLHGFQAARLFEPDAKEEDLAVYVAKVWTPDMDSVPDGEIERWGHELGAPEGTVTEVDFLGRSFIRVHISQWSIIPDIINLALLKGYWVEIWTNLRVTFSPTDPKYNRFDPLRYEAQYAESLRSKWKGRRLGEWLRFNEGKRDILLLEDNWMTDEGKALCRELRNASSPYACAEADNVSAIRFYTHAHMQRVCREHGLYQFGTWWYAPREEGEEGAPQAPPHAPSPPPPPLSPSSQRQSPSPKRVFQVAFDELYDPVKEAKV